MNHRDFGAPRSPRHWRWHVLGVVGWLAITTAVVTPQLLRDRAAALAEAEAWAIEGPPCPQLAPAEAGRWPYRPKESFGYAGVNFAFAYGHVACAQIHDDDGRAVLRGHPVCQFTSPAVVALQFEDKTAFFTPGLGQRTTVSVEGGVARCVMAGDFYGQNGF